jgi:hypothetical protein
MSDDIITVTVTRSAGDDRAVLVLIDTEFDVRDDPGLRVLLNDDEIFVGKAYDLGASHNAEAKSLSLRLDEIPYLDTEYDPHAGMKHRYYEEN